MVTETWLNVAEKPSVAKEISRILATGSGHPPRTCPSQSRFNPVFEFPYRGVQMLFTSVAGHLMEDQFPPSAKSWSAVPFADLFHLPITKFVKEDFQPLKKNLESLATRCQRLVLWLDCDREGENIAFEVISVVQGKAPRGFTISRAKFSTLSPVEIERAMLTLGTPNKHLSDAVDARQEMDLRIGAVFTRFQTLTLRDRCGPALAEHLPSVVSFGPCQIPCLGFVVARHFERTVFVREKFYGVTLSIVDAGIAGGRGTAAIAFAWDRGPIYDACTAAVLVAAMNDRATAEDNSARIASVDRRVTRRRPPPPLATVEMQKLASQHLRMASDKCMQFAEELYQEGVISYPRTETDGFTATDADLRALILIQAQGGDASASWATYARTLLHTEPHDDTSAPPAVVAAEAAAVRYRRPHPGGHDDGAHPPIHPLKYVPGLTSESGGPKGALYELIVRHFLACCSPDAESADVQVRLLHGGESFHAGGHTILSKGWMQIFIYERWNSSVTVPNFTVGSVVRPTSLQVTEGVTEAPAYLNESQLIASMDTFGIGTDATIATHIKTIQDRGYAVLDGTQFRPTPLGLALASALHKANLSQLLNPQLRAQMERAMGDIARGLVAKEEVVKAAVQLYKTIFLQYAAAAGILVQTVARQLSGGGEHSDDDEGHESAATSRGGTTANSLRMLPHGASAQLPLQQEHLGIGTCGGCGSGVLDIWRHEVSKTRYARCRACFGLRPHDAPLLRLPNKGTLTACLDPVTSAALRCPICRYSALDVKNDVTGTLHRVCVFCFSHPPTDFIPPGELSGEHRCFNCTHSACPLAGAAVAGAAGGGGGGGAGPQSLGDCPLCGNALRLLGTGEAGAGGGGGTAPHGSKRPFVGCKGHPVCRASIGLPACNSTSVSNSTCSTCGLKLINFEFSLVQCPPSLEPVATVCVLCDAQLEGFVSLRGGLRRPSDAVGAAAANRSDAGRSAAPHHHLAAGGSSGAAYQLPDIHSLPVTATGAIRARKAADAASSEAPGASPPCQCGKPSVRRVTRSGANAGRPFYTCAARGCKFFCWIDGDVPVAS